MATRSGVSSFFQMHGLILKRDACDLVVESLKNRPRNDHKKWMETVASELQKLKLASSIISLNEMQDALRIVEHSDSDISTDKIFSVIDAFTVPKFVYHQERKKFIPVSTASVAARSLLGNVDAKTALCLDRYTIIHQSLLRHDLFQPELPGKPSAQQGTKFQLKRIEYLLGCLSKTDNVVVLGMLTQLKEGAYFLEDPTGTVRLNLSETKFHTGFFTECSFVLAEGCYEDNVFHVKGLGFPPAEPQVVSRACFGNINFFGGPSPTCAKASEKLRMAEEFNQNASFVIIADVWLDDVKVINKLHQLFGGFALCPPTCFLFLGNFTSVQQEDSSCTGLSEYFLRLADVILEFPTLVSTSKFVFVPGPMDPGLTMILPKPPLAQSITEGIRQKVPGSIFTTNPCRIQYCTQEIVVLREDLVTKMCRNCVYFPSEGDVPSQFAKTLASQVHLCPLPLHVAPVFWEYGHSLSLYPLPDVVICGDKYDPFSVSHADCKFVNPGSFPRNDYVFKVYIPATKQVEDSKIADDCLSKTEDDCLSKTEDDCLSKTEDDCLSKTEDDCMSKIEDDCMMP